MRGKLEEHLDGWHVITEDRLYSSDTMNNVVSYRRYPVKSQHDAPREYLPFEEQKEVSFELISEELFPDTIFAKLIPNEIQSLQPEIERLRSIIVTGYTGQQFPDQDIIYAPFIPVTTTPVPLYYEENPWKEIFKNRVGGFIKLDDGSYMEIEDYLNKYFEKPIKK